MSSIASLAAVVAFLASITSAKPIDTLESIAQTVTPKQPPAGWKTDYLQNYMDYHIVYIALSCQSQHDTTFFDDCCHPLLSTQNLYDNRKPECIPTAAQYAAALPLLEAEAKGTPIGSTPCIPSGTVSSSAADVEPTATSTPGENHYAEPTPTPTATTASDSPAPTSSSEDPAPTQSSTTDAGSWAGAFEGQMTYFLQNGNAGSCGQIHSDSEWGVAIKPDFNANGDAQGSSCGRTIEIQDINTGKVLTAPVWDTCPTCVGDGIDASRGLFTQFASTAAGVVNVKWKFV